jgi:cytochrome c-type biogenesis protein CcmH
MMMRAAAMRIIAVAAVVAALIAPALAVQPDEILADPALEARARALSRELRCMVCQNQSIDDSDAPLARDLRILVRERLKAGDSDDKVLNFLTARYGEFVLLKPRLGWETAILWLAPAAVLGLGVFILVFSLRRRRRQTAGVPSDQPQLSDEECARLAELLGPAASSTGGLPPTH